MRITFVLAAALLISACGDSGPPSLENTNYWRAKLSKGEGDDYVVSKGSAAVPLIRELLQDQNEWVVQSGARVASKIGAPAAAVVPSLVEALERYPTQVFVMQALAKMKGSSVEYLVPLLKRNDAKAQELGVKALNGIGHEAAPAIEPLMAIIEDTAASNALRRHALVTLGSIGTPAESVMDRLQKIYDTDDALKRDAAMARRRIRTEKKVIKKGGDR